VTHTLIRGGRLLDGPADILIRGDTIHEVSPPGTLRSGDFQLIDASGKLLHAGLVNAHMHGHGSLSKGMGDRWTLELLLTAAPWTGGHRSLED
jgi:guanine deaminase